MHNKSIAYRPDIDGLRAVAVLSVLLFHLGFNFIPGGFVGVDIFFVISGYLISKIIYTEIENKRFSITNFYVRRARRILPAHASVFVLSSVFAVWLLYPSELVSYAKSALASALFSANIYFFEAINYFSPSANEIPLLHLWSLGIEEQFYIVFPLIAILFAGRRIFSKVVAALLITSLIASIWMLTKDPSAAFYLLPFRAFEMLIGCYLSLPKKLPTNKNVYNISFIVGLACIFCSILFYKESMRFPGAAALLPSLGSAFVIFGGLDNNKLSKMLLGNKFLVFIGKISYSLYLIHWPVIVFGRRIFPLADFYIFSFSALAISLILAYLNYIFIEQHFRHTKLNIKPIKVLGIALSVICVMVFSSGFVIYKSGFQSTLDERTEKVLSYLQYDFKSAYLSRTCFLDPDQDPDDVDLSKCLPQGKGRKAILWGDSHAIQFYSGFKETLESQGYNLGVITASACPPILGADVAARPMCKKFNDKAFPLIAKEKPDILIMSASWNIEESNMDLLENTLKEVNKLGIKKVVLLGESPLYKQSVPILVADRLKLGITDMTASDELEKGFLDISETIMTKRFANRDDVEYISVMNAVCPDYKCPLTAPDEAPVHFDIAHLTESGARLFAKILTPLILD